MAGKAESRVSTNQLGGRLTSRCAQLGQLVIGSSSIVKLMRPQTAKVSDKVSSRVGQMFSGEHAYDWASPNDALSGKNICSS